MQSFQIGDVVRLKSGGPLMTVTYLTDQNKVQCHWFGSLTEKPILEAFPPAALEKLDE
jgi:uncharacterized protein YodC (DUF2158 family)